MNSFLGELSLQKCSNGTFQSLSCPIHHIYVLLFCLLLLLLLSSWGTMAWWKQSESGGTVSHGVRLSQSLQRGLCAGRRNILSVHLYIILSAAWLRFLSRRYNILLLKPDLPLDKSRSEQQTLHVVLKEHKNST